MVADEIALENKEKISKAVSESNKNRNSNSVHLDANDIYATAAILILCGKVVPPWDNDELVRWW